MSIYLDYAATTPLDLRVLEEMTPYLTEVFANPSSTHSFGRKAKVALETARKKLASLLSCNPNEIIFTSGGTEANNLALKGTVKAHGIENIITSEIEHHAVLNTIKSIKSDFNLPVHYVGLKPSGEIDLLNLEQLLIEHPKALVSIMHGNNEIGILNPIDKIKKLCEMHKAIFHSDTIQSISHVKFSADTLPDLAVASAHKFYGPKGIGFLYAKKRPSALIHGGSQERESRAGTENVASIVGMVKALELAYNDLENREFQLKKYKKHLINQLQRNIDGVIFNQPEDGLSSIVSVSIPRPELAQTLLFSLDLGGIAISGGSACASGALKGSHVLKVIHGQKSLPTIRFSFGEKTTFDELDKSVSVLAKILN